MLSFMYKLSNLHIYEATFLSKYRFEIAGQWSHLAHARWVLTSVRNKPDDIMETFDRVYVC